MGGWSSQAKPMCFALQFPLLFVCLFVCLFTAADLHNTTCYPEPPDFSYTWDQSLNAFFNKSPRRKPPHITHPTLGLFSLTPPVQRHPSLFLQSSGR